ncbi:MULTISPECIES: endo-1,4-beta-xylanase [Hallerella]|uniref:endo-1,4-beta-xylanase n=1 Tax=Hallerella TaxID=2815788 RepID=UPI0023F0CC89|nr:MULTISPECIES: endo-1,4-beta-xylanase [Hallerella]MCI6873959.1 endo-1,4-beta-xylanase [Hallerella sp.]MDD6091808.1 endo-1,4-beta-xylanase [Hallerella succinigenes]
MNFWKAAVLGSALLCGTDAFAADSTLSELAAARGRFVGSILNSEWFNNSLGSDATIYESTHKANFNIVVAENEMKFDATEPSRGSFSFTKGDKLMAYAAANGMQVRGHALAWHSQVPSWVSTLAQQVESAGGSARDTLLSVLKTHIDSVVGHYKGKIREWDVVNEAINDNGTHGWRSEGSVWYQYIGRDFIDSAFVWAHKADPDAKLYYNDYALEWGMGTGTKAQFAYDSIAVRLKNAGIYITGIGTQTHIQNTHTSTPSNLRTLASKLKSIGMTMQITELDIGFALGTAISDADYAAQGHLYRQFMDLFLEAENMEAFVIWGFSDKYSWLKDQSKYNGLIFDSSFAKKPAYDSLVASLKAHDASTVTAAGSVDPVEWESGSTFGKATYVIVDYTTAGAESVGSWNGDVAAGLPSFVSTALDGVTGYMDVPLAGCDQSEESCGYQHAIYTLPDDAVSKNVLAKCENLLITMRGKTETNYVNVGVNSPWFSLQYGRAAEVGSWSEATVDLQAVRDSAAAPTQLTFNSNGSGVYVTKIAAVGCPDDLSPIQKVSKRSNLGMSFANKNLYVNGTDRAKVELFDMQGRPVLKALNVNGSVSLQGVANGLYVVRVSTGSVSLMKRIVIQ